MYNSHDIWNVNLLKHRENFQGIKKSSVWKNVLVELRVASPLRTSRICVYSKISCVAHKAARGLTTHERLVYLFQYFPKIPKSLFRQHNVCLAKVRPEREFSWSEFRHDLTENENSSHFKSLRNRRFFFQPPNVKTDAK